MHKLSWKPEYKIGHSLIDREHKHLFEIALEAFVPVIPELRKNKIKKTILELKEYMKLHFMHEESFMRVHRISRFQSSFTNSPRYYKKNERYDC